MRDCVTGYIVMSNVAMRMYVCASLELIAACASLLRKPACCANTQLTTANIERL